ncbi:MAG: dihydrodipicolinate reductase [Desulfurococcales archaeon]|nr:dihydrodipicolinate reductase [Desulfurococcales archaeon]
MRFAIYGLGPIGGLISKVAIARGYEPIAAIDIDPNKIGRDMGEIISIGEKMDVRVSGDPKVLYEVKPDIVFHATGTWFHDIYKQLVHAIDSGADIVSTCETLSYPYYRYPELSSLLDEYAKTRGVTVLGTGINPGFLLDSLPAFMSTSMAILEKIVAVRSLDASKRRTSFQKKIGVNMDPEQYKKALASGELTGHVGFAESVLLLSQIAGLDIDRIKEGQEPIVATEKVSVNGMEVDEGRVIGVIGFGKGFIENKEVLRIEMRAGIGFKNYEEIKLIGEPETTWRSTGTHGDLGTAAVIVNIASRVLDQQPGLITMADLVKGGHHIV